ncbi:MAG TPA: GNAT family N-acetyltransferase [Chitinophagaceae bacterium]|nr:GNAT family N-acetyltransferase [Chitinophagaceae bacterium]
MAILPFTKEFTQDVIDLILSIQAAEFDVHVTLDAQSELKNIPAFFQTGSGNFWIALAEGKVVGTIGLLDIGHNAVALRKMFVHADYRGQPHRAGQQLLDQAFRWAETKDINKIYLGTLDKFKAAHKFYEKSGFRLIAERELPSYFPIMHVDTIFYERDLRSRR